MPINDQGSGLVSAINSPATDWNKLHELGRTAHRKRKTLKDCTPAKGSIPGCNAQSGPPISGVT